LGMKPRHPLIDGAAVLVGAEDRQLDDPLVRGAEPGRLDIEHREPCCAGRPGCVSGSRGLRRLPAAGEAIEQSHRSPFWTVVSDCSIVAEGADIQARFTGARVWSSPASGPVRQALRGGCPETSSVTEFLTHKCH